MNLPAHARNADLPAVEGRVVAFRRPHAYRPITAAASRRSGREAEDRAQALERVCANFRTTISPRSAARLADLLGTTTVTASRAA